MKHNTQRHRQHFHVCVLFCRLLEEQREPAEHERPKPESFLKIASFDTNLQACLDDSKKALSYQTGGYVFLFSVVNLWDKIFTLAYRALVDHFRWYNDVKGDWSGSGEKADLLSASQLTRHTPVVLHELLHISG